jgi:hypothetical protein
MVGCAVDRFNGATDRRFGYTPMLNHNHESLFKIGSTCREVPYQKNIASSFEDNPMRNDAVRQFLRCRERRV